MILSGECSKYGFFDILICSLHRLFKYLIHKKPFAIIGVDVGPPSAKVQDIILAAMATEPDISFAPVQVQKLFFLIDQDVAGPVGGPFFNFEPYDYGPYDKDVYRQLEMLEVEGLVYIEQDSSTNRRSYGLTSKGFNVGQEKLAALPPVTAQYLSDISEWMRSLTFAQLVGEVYKAFPAMKVNSVFQG